MELYAGLSASHCFSLIKLLERALEGLTLEGGEVARSGGSKTGSAILVASIPTILVTLEIDYYRVSATSILNLGDSAPR